MDMVAVRAILKMRECGLAPKRFRKAVRHLQETAQNATHLLASGVLLTDGAHVYEIARDSGRLISLTEKGQITFTFALRSLAEDVKRRLPKAERSQVRLEEACGT